MGLKKSGSPVVVKIAGNQVEIKLVHDGDERSRLQRQRQMRWLAIQRKRRGDRQE